MRTRKWVRDATPYMCLNFQVEEPAVIVEPHFMDMLFEQVRVLTDTASCSAGLTDPNRKRNQHCQEYILILIF